MTKLKQAIIQNQTTLKFYMIGILAATSFLLAFLSVQSQVPSQVWAQITPSLALDSSGNGIGFMAQDPADPVQNSTSANITQLATILPAVNQPIIPASFTPTIGATEDPDDSTSSNDDDDSDSSSNDDDDSDSSSSDSDNDSSSSDNDDNDNGDDDSDGGDDGDGGGSSASAGGGGAFASAG